jgi:hypothetical protein
MAIEIGDRVLHPRFGSGTVIEMDGSKITIQFDNKASRDINSAFLIPWGTIEVKLSGALRTS